MGYFRSWRFISDPFSGFPIVHFSTHLVIWRAAKLTKVATLTFSELLEKVNLYFPEKRVLSMHRLILPDLDNAIIELLRFPFAAEKMFPILARSCPSRPCSNPALASENIFCASWSTRRTRATQAASLTCSGVETGLFTFSTNLHFKPSSFLVLIY